MNAFNEIMDTISPIFRDGKESKQDALVSLLTEAIMEANPNQGTVADDRRAAQRELALVRFLLGS